MCIRDSIVPSGTVHAVIDGDKANATLTQDFHNLTDFQTVSYTHLDVYKRQVHVHICAQKRLYRVNDNQPCVVFLDCPCYCLLYTS